MVIGAALLADAAGQVDIGQRYLAHCNKQLVSRDPSPIVELLDYSNDSMFLEPWLFAYFGCPASGVTLEQILFGYLTDRSALPTFTARSNSRGLVFIPRIGYIQVDAPNSDVTVNDACLAKEALQLQTFAGTPIELCLSNDALLDGVLAEAGGGDLPFDSASLKTHADILDSAFGILQQVSPELYSCLSSVTRRVVVFSSTRLPSFATVRAHGAAFLNVTPPSVKSEAFFIEDLAHQCGHILFSALSVDRDAYLAIDASTPLRQFTQVEGEVRDIYTALHGVYTEALMCLALHDCLDAAVFSDERDHELAGRLSFIMKRFHLDLMSLNHQGIFTDRGLDIISECGKIFDEVYRHHRVRIVGLDLRNQEYVFSLERFLERNPVGVSG